MEPYNLAQALTEMAARAPFRPAIVFPAGRDRQGRARYTQLSFQQLNELCDRYAYGLSEYGLRRGDRTLLMVRPGIELVTLAFALLKIGAVPVLIDPGMGRKAWLQCVAETEPTALIGVPLAHGLRILFPQPFQGIQHSVTVGRRWLWGGVSLDQLQNHPPGRKPFPIAPTTTEDEAAVTFTSGSTGLPKGVVYLHGMFRAQIELLRTEIGIAEGEIDLPGLYIFALFNPALGVTTIMPDLDPRKPAQVNPAFLVEAIQTHGVTTSFGSPTIWQRVGQYCLENKLKLPSLKRILMAGAPVPPALIERFTHILEGGEVYTPFGATEALPLTSISGREILAETAALSESGHGVCVGRALKGITIKIIPLTDEPIAEWDEALALPAGQVGEIIVKGAVVTRQYLNRPHQTMLAKIRDGNELWGRMGDLGYFDEQGRLWFCGRKSQRVETPHGLMLPVCCEAIFNRQPDVARTALVGVGQSGRQKPVLVVEPKPGKMPGSATVRQRFIAELLALGRQYEHTREIQDILFHPAFPVDVRHNAKIQREKLAGWAEKRLPLKR